MNRRVREPYARWCERLSPSVFTGGAVYSISRSVFIFSVIFLSICYFVSVCRALGKTHSLTSFGCSVGSWGLAMCVAVKRWLSCFYPFLYSTFGSAAMLNCLNYDLFDLWIALIFLFEFTIE